MNKRKFLLQLSSFTEYFQVPGGLEFGPHLPPLKEKDLVKMKRKKKKSKEKAEKDRAARLFQRQEKLRRRVEKLQRRAEKREEEKKIRAEQGEPEVRKARRSTRKGNHCSEKVDAVIFKVLGRSHKKTAPKSKDKKVRKEEVAGPKWRHGMREEKHEDRTGKGQKVKKRGQNTRTVKKQPVEKQPVEKPLEEKPVEQQPKEKQALEKQPCFNIGHMKQPLEEEKPCVDVGADYEADGAHFGHCDGTVELAWPLGPDCDGEAELARPLSNQTLLEPTPPCQVRTK